MKSGTLKFVVVELHPRHTSGLLHQSPEPLRDEHLAGQPAAHSIMPVLPAAPDNLDEADGEDGEGVGGGVGVGVGEGEGSVRKDSWMTILFVKSSSAGGVGGKGGLDKASATLLDSPAT